MSAPKRDIYLLSPRQLSPETIAVAFAKTSRAPESFREIAAELTDDKSAQFHEKWVLGYGHASVAEHAVLHLAIENASRLAMEAIESNRLASYTEKSTRYQKWDADYFYIPPELDDHPLRPEFISACQRLFQTYAKALIPLKKLVETRSPRRESETDDAWDRRIRSQYVDVCRFLLPAASLANVGVTANGRVLENAIRKWTSSPLAEVREIGETVKAAAKNEIPTLLKYAEPIPYLVETSRELEEMSLGLTAIPDTSSCCELVHFDQGGEERILASALYRFGGMSYQQALTYLRSLPAETGTASVLLQKLGRFDTPLRELEHCTYTFDLLMDQGAYAEFKRHRMMTQTPQKLTCALGYAVPSAFVQAGFDREYRQVMDETAVVWQKLAAWNPQVAQYIVPNGFNRRVLATFNLREAYAFCQIRTAANAHFSIRRIAQKAAEEIKRVHPILSSYMKLQDETWQSIEDQYFTSMK
ncbi:MAG: FAD-dependent thymidylate synthase [Chloroflexota bacterium]